jgi:hypothetical protein
MFYYKGIVDVSKPLRTDFYRVEWNTFREELLILITQVYLKPKK